jgi:hypothetical protein
MQEEFTVYRDGEVDSRFARQKRMQAAGQALRSGFGVMFAPLKVGTMRALDEWDLMAYDQRHGTHMLNDYRAKRRTARNLDMARRYELV